MAAGAGAIAKKFTKEKNLIERQANCKEPRDYVARFDEMLNGQKAFWTDDSEKDNK